MTSTLSLINLLTSRTCYNKNVIVTQCNFTTKYIFEALFLFTYFLKKKGLSFAGEKIILLTTRSTLGSEIILSHGILASEQ